MFSEFSLFRGSTDKNNTIYIGRIESPENYINASPIESVSFEKNSAFQNAPPLICSQAPLPNTVKDHWSLIYQENIKYIVMLCNLKEGAKDQCTQYWPRSLRKPAAISGTDLIIEMVSEDIMNALTIKRKFEIGKKEQKTKRKVTQFHVSLIYANQMLSLEKKSENISAKGGLIMESQILPYSKASKNS